LPQYNSRNPKSREEEEAELQAAIKASLNESQRYIGQRNNGGTSSASADSGQKAQQRLPVKVEEEPSLLDLMTAPVTTITPTNGGSDLNTDVNAFTSSVTEWDAFVATPSPVGGNEHAKSFDNVASGLMELYSPPASANPTGTTATTGQQTGQQTYPTGISPQGSVASSVGRGGSPTGGTNDPFGFAAQPQHPPQPAPQPAPQLQVQAYQMQQQNPVSPQENSPPQDPNSFYAANTVDQSHTKNDSIVGDALKSIVNLDNLNISPSTAANPFATTFSDSGSIAKLGDARSQKQAGGKKSVMMQQQPQPQPMQQQQQTQMQMQQQQQQQQQQQYQQQQQTWGSGNPF